MRAVKRKRIGIAMSGGVDSTVCALYVRQYHDVEGFFMRLAQPDIDRQLSRVQDIAAQLDIPLHVIDLSRQFEEMILRYFTESYRDGITPNPCMLCNREIKFGLFMDTILARGMDGFATGHYARIIKKQDRWHLHAGTDKIKDQSYFLARLSQKHLEKLMLPLGEMNKEETYAIAEDHGLLDFRGTESQDVCFLHRNGLAFFLSERLGALAAEGPIETREGHRLGLHKGLFRYTVGQRRGLGLADLSPWYVIALAKDGNKVVVGQEEDLYRANVTIDNLNWLSGLPPKDETVCRVKIRSTHCGAEATIRRFSVDTWQVTFKQRQRAVTPGQFAVLYEGDEIIGSGEITKDS